MVKFCVLRRIGCEMEVVGILLVFYVVVGDGVFGVDILKGGFGR